MLACYGQQEQTIAALDRWYCIGYCDALASCAVGEAAVLLASQMAGAGSALAIRAMHARGVELEQLFQGIDSAVGEAGCALVALGLEVALH